MRRLGRLAIAIVALASCGREEPVAPPEPPPTTIPANELVTVERGTSGAWPPRHRPEPG